MDKDHPIFGTFWKDVEQLSSKVAKRSASTEAAATDPPPGPPPPPPPAPPPPLPDGAGKNIALIPEKMTNVAKSRVYKRQKDIKMIDKVHWSPVTKAMATNQGVIWQKAAEGEMDTVIDIDPARVEDLFAEPHVKQVEEKAKAPDKVGKNSKVCIPINGLCCEIPCLL